MNWWLFFFFLILKEKLTHSLFQSISCEDVLYFCRMLLIEMFEHPDMVHCRHFSNVHTIYIYLCVCVLIVLHLVRWITLTKKKKSLRFPRTVWTTIQIHPQTQSDGGELECSRFRWVTAFVSLLIVNAVKRTEHPEEWRTEAHMRLHCYHH